MTGLPRVQYARKYHVYPADATLERRLQIAEYATKLKETVGGSYDDAGLGALEVKQAILWDIPEEKRQEFLDWFDVEYPGTIVVFMGEEDLPSPKDFKIEDEVDSLPKHETKTYPVRPRAAINCVAIHHTVTTGDYSMIEAIANYHVSNNDWPGIGYHFCITDDGRIIQTNKLTTISYHVGRLNICHVGVALLGDFTNNNPTERQLEAAHWLVEHLKEILPNPLWIVPHRNVNYVQTSCPGSTWEDWFSEISTGPTDCLPYEDNPPDPPPGLEPISKMMGLHASTDPWISGEEFLEFLELRPGVIKVLSTIEEGHARTLGRDHPQATRIVRAFLSFGGRQVSPQQFADWTADDVERTINALSGDVWVELHNEPNLVPEGLSSSWRNGAEFGDWLNEVVKIYRLRLPGIKLISPGLSPGFDLIDLRQNHIDFTNGAAIGMGACDAIGVHAYWSETAPMQEALDIVEWFSQKFPNHKMFITEASHNGMASWEKKAEEYVDFVTSLVNFSNVLGVTYFVASSLNPEYANELWVGNNVASMVRGILNGRREN